MPEIPKAYKPQEVEDRIYKKWEESGFFNPDNLDLPEKAKKFVISMPPPNATGVLHLGHASMLAYQDLMIRYHRLKGERTLWLPGTDHAAIATQTKVEKIIAKEGKTKYDLGREEFLKRVEEYVENSRNVIRGQTKKMGSSCDWSRERYTLDEGLSRAVKEVFVKMYKDGLIYRGDRIVNWCPRCESTLADDEVEYKEQKTKLYYFRYTKNFPITIATTRPETKLGDTAIAVNPKDERYKNYIGKVYEIDLGNGARSIKIIADRTVDMDFGTGALGVTPAHSMADWEMAQKNNLEIIKVIGEDGRMTSRAGREYEGLTVLEARRKFVKYLEESGLIEKVEEIDHNLSVCYRCDTPIEPLPSLQWFVNVNKKLRIKSEKLKVDGEYSLKELALYVVKSGLIKIIPSRFEKIYFQWIENLHDWCISRQIWFGHRVPVWYRAESQLAGSKSQINSKAKTKNSKVWNLKIYGKDIFQALKNGTKKIETRAGRPRGSGKYWGDFKKGDIVRFSLADEKTDSVVSAVLPVERIVDKVKHFRTIEEVFEVYPPDDCCPGKSLDEIKKWWKNRPALRERISKYGIWVIELADPESQKEQEEVYVGIEPPKGRGWRQDSDTLDTWFSSSLWTFSTLLDKNHKRYETFEKWIENSSDLVRFHPTSVMETGYDLIFFWIARMILMTTYVLGDIPFEKVYLHGMVRDKYGRKMSKSLGNGIDPVEMIDKYGTDALRLSMIIGSSPGNDIKLYEEKIEGYRNFVNKLWNISRYVLMSTGSESANRSAERLPGENDFTLADRWILNRLNILIERVTDDLDNFRFSQAGEKLKDFTWGDFADWYIEISKVEKEKDDILRFVLEKLLVLWHPFAPFVTEEIWKNFGKKELLMVQKWPRKFDVSGFKEKDEDDFKLIQDIITSIRALRSENRIESARKIKAIVVAAEKNKIELIKEQSKIIESLSRLKSLEVYGDFDRKKNTAFASLFDVNVYLPLEGLVDIEKEKERLKKEIDETRTYLERIKRKLDNKGFISNAPAFVVEREIEKRKETEKKLEDLERRLRSFCS